MESIFRSVFVEFLGVFARWGIGAITNKLRGKEIVGFWEVWNGRKESSDSELFLYGVSNILIGYVVIALLIGLGFLIDAIWF